MAVVEPFGFEDVLSNIQKKTGAKRQDNTAILRELQFIAEEACNMARDTYKGGNPDAGTSHQDGGYDDHTRNLRGSIGYRIFYNGQVVAEGGFNGQGSPEGEAAAKSALEGVTGGKTLWEVVVVAGMHYARYVEAKGYPVVTFVQGFLNEQLTRLKQKIKAGKI